MELVIYIYLPKYMFTFRAQELSKQGKRKYHFRIIFGYVLIRAYGMGFLTFNILICIKPVPKVIVV